MRTQVLEKQNKPPRVMVISGGKMRVYNLYRLLVVGRTTDEGHADIDLPCSYVSRRHGIFGRDEQGFFYSDTGSTNGTFLRGRRLTPNTKVYLRDGTVLQMYGSVVKSPDDFTVMIFMTEYPDHFGKSKIELNNVSEIKIGRNIGNGLNMNDSAVSELHASFFAAKLGWAIVDHQSTNGVCINGHRMTEPCYLKVGDCVRIANYYFIYSGSSIICQTLIEMNDRKPEAENRQPVPPVSNQNSMPMYRSNPEINRTPPQINRVQPPINRIPPSIQQPVPGFVPNSPAPKPEPAKKPGKPKRNFGNNAPLDIHIVKRSIWEKAKTRLLLEDIDIQIQPGEMVLILGGSGAGKTTFMNAVMGYEKAQGTIKHGARDIYKDFAEMKYEIGFVPQQDLLRGGDIVYDTLKSAAEMKLPANISNQMLLDRVNKVLNTLGLTREKEKLVSKLSGGQRKRLSIAVEYIADPSLFFLDEPDSGLDGNMATSLMNNLRDIADEGKIVMVITHAPDRVWSLFDKVVVLAKKTSNDSGNLAFFGSPEEAKQFFETETLEDIVRRINRPDEGGEGKGDYFIDKYKSMKGRK